MTPGRVVVLDGTSRRGPFANDGVIFDMDVPGGLDVTWVRVRIDLDVLEAREEARADRVLGMARWQYDKVHRHPTYDVTVDTGALDPDAAADVVCAALRSR